MDTLTWHALIETGVGLCVAAYAYMNIGDPAFDGHTETLVETIANSLNETGLTDGDDPDTFYYDD